MYENLKEMFEYIGKQDLSMEEMGVKHNDDRKGKNPKLVDTIDIWNGRSPLMEAASNGHTRVCKYLITKQNANVDARDYCQDTALISAVMGDHVDIVRLI